MSHPLAVVRRRTGVVILTAAVAAAGTFTAGRSLAPAKAAYPADKVVASGNKIAKFSPGAAVELLKATMKTSSPTDLILHVTMECSILTDTIIVGGPDATTETTHTNGNVRVWVEVDGKIVPLSSMSTGATTSTPTAGNDTDKVTFCNRTFNRTVTDMEDPLDGIDYSRDYIETKDANGFNWLKLNLGSGIHNIVVKADLTHEATDPSKASAMVGNRTLIVQPAKMANDAVI